EHKNKVRYKVPPTGASGTSTAIFADRVRMPLKMLQSMIGVFPVAIKTIMVSPTARPRPIIAAAKIPGLAEGTMMRQTVCQRLAPRANDEDASSFGTLDKLSSEMEKIIGMTATPRPTAMIMLLR